MSTKPVLRTGVVRKKKPFQQPPVSPCKDKTAPDIIIEVTSTPEDVMIKCARAISAIPKDVWWQPEYEDAHRLNLAAQSLRALTRVAFIRGSLEQYWLQEINLTATLIDGESTRGSPFWIDLFKEPEMLQDLSLQTDLVYGLGRHLSVAYNKAIEELNE